MPREVETFAHVMDARVSAIHLIRPLEDPRWSGLIEQHPRASVFHSSEWLQALHQTYGYEPVAFTTTAAGEELQNAILGCRINSWLTGRRIVSLPFSDHCDPLLEAAADIQHFLPVLANTLHKEKLRYVELRPLAQLAETGVSLLPEATYYFHQLDLAPSLETLFRNLHKDSIQRRIRRAEREGLVYENGRSPSLLQDFWRLHLLTRRRHHIPPQPFKWFQALVDIFGSNLQIRVAYHGGQPVAAILTLRHKETLVYKYGCSDEAFHNLGGTPYLLWMTIQEASREGLRVFDLGRSDVDNAGLVTFKDRWGAAKSTLIYYRLVPANFSFFSAIPEKGAGLSRAKRVLASLPDSLFCLTGNLLYKHIG